MFDTYKNVDITQVGGMNLTESSDIRSMLHGLEKTISLYEGYGQKRDAKILEKSIVEIIENNNPDYLRAMLEMVRVPVTIDEFIHGDEYLGQLTEVWPAIEGELKIIKPDIWTGEAPVLEVLNRSAIGTGKSEMAKVSMLYDLYALTCYGVPQKLYTGITAYTTMIFSMQSAKDSVTKKVLYNPLRKMFLDMPYTKKYVRHNKDKESVLELQDLNIMVYPGLAAVSTTIGQAIIGAVVDEASFMRVIKESKQVSGPTGDGGLFDQADDVYRHLSRRRKSRFLTKGVDIGCIYVSSSVNYTDDFLDRRMKQIKPEDTHIKVISKTKYEVRPDSFSGEMFRFLVGTNEITPRILKSTDVEGIDYPEGARVENVPVELRSDFRDDPENSQREVLNIASTSINRFIAQTHTIVEAGRLFKKLGGVNFVVNQNTILSETGYPTVDSENMPEYDDYPRFVHVDLSRTGDRCAVAMAHVKKYVAYNRDGVRENLPLLFVDFAVSIDPDINHPIDISEIRSWISLLKTRYEYNIKAVTYDGFDSRESIQIWRKMGMNSYEISMDKTTAAYDALRQALYQNRLALPDNNLLRDELAQLERRMKGGKIKIDHPPKGSKDLADAVAGACYSASIDRVTTTKTETVVLDTDGEPVLREGRKRVNRRRVSR